MSASTDLVTGIIQRGLLYFLQKLVPGAVADVGGIPGAVLKAALGMPFVQNLEAKIGADAAEWAGEKIVAAETDVKQWLDAEFKDHPAVAAFVAAVKPPADTKFTLTDAQEAALLAAIADGTLNAKLGVAA